MTESKTTARLRQSSIGWAAEVLSGLVVPGVLPDLAKLAVRLAASCRQRISAGGVAVALPAPGAALLESGWESAENNCLILVSEELGPVWSSVADDWQLAVKTSGISQGPGSGPWPADELLPLEGSQWAWQQMVLFLGDNPVLTILVVHGATAGVTRQVEMDLQQLQAALSPLLQIWATARKLDFDLNQARTENQALSRLNLLQEKVVALASHELKTPLTSITAYSEALRGQITDVEFSRATEFLDVIRNEAARLLRMVNRVLDFSRLGLGLELLEVQPEEIEPLVSETILALHHSLAAKGLRLETDFRPGLPRVLVDADLIRQVLVNLLGNAIKYTPAGGQITVSLKEVEASVEVSVSDTGLGIPTLDLQRIFKEFYRTKGLAQKEEGSGLGLSIVKNIMNLHGGHIDVSRRPEGGTVFSCFLPKQIKAPSAMPKNFSGRSDRDHAWRLVTILGYLAAELTGSRASQLQLRDEREELVTVAVMGPEAESSDPGLWREVELSCGQDSLGSLKVGHPLTGRPYDQGTEAQLQVIGDVTARALSYLKPGTTEGDGASSQVKVAKVIEAVRALLQSRRYGIPTSTAQALDLVAKLGRLLGIENVSIRRLQNAAMLHDAGMARVEVEIVKGESELSWDQRDEVERHVEQGVDLMAPLILDPDILTVIRHHHERVDGQGYPDGLQGQEIPLGSRLLAVIDAWFALTRDRTFRPGLLPADALKEIKNHTGTQFDAGVVNAFESVLVGEEIIPGSPAGTQN